LTRCAWRTASSFSSPCFTDESIPGLFSMD
jgi:hypothetical protein